MTEPNQPPNKEPKVKTGAEIATPPEGQQQPEVLDDAGSRALSEALKSSFLLVKIMMVILVIVFFSSGVFTVPPQENAIILRFGKPVGVGEQQLLGPGLHWSFPYPIDEVIRIPISRVQSITSSTAWYGITPEDELAGIEPFIMPSLNPDTEGYALTADGNIIHIRATIRYRISEPLNYVLLFEEAQEVTQQLLDNAVLTVAARFTVDQVLGEGSRELKEGILSMLRRSVDGRELGITVEDGDIRIIAPRQVKMDFDQVTSASLERRRAIDDAQAYANRIVSRAQGEAAQLVNAGETDKSRIVQAVQSEAESFKTQLPHFERSPELFMSRIQLEALNRILTNRNEKFLIMEDPDKQPIELRLQLSREPERRNSATNAPGQ